MCLAFDGVAVGRKRWFGNGKRKGDEIQTLGLVVQYSSPGKADHRSFVIHVYRPVCFCPKLAVHIYR